MEELVKQNWNYILYSHENELILSVLCGTVAHYDVEVKLDKEQKAEFKLQGEAFLDNLAQQIRENPFPYIKE